MVARHMAPIRQFWPLLAFGVVLLVACQAASEPTPAAIEVEAVDEPEVVATPTPAVESDMNENEATPGGTSSSDEAGAADADVEFVRATLAADDTWRFDVTVRHPDTGWEDYADGWDVVTPDGRVLKVDEGDPFTRLLLHPHENEQPFTRSQRGIAVPEGVTSVVVRAHDLVDGFGGREVQVDLNSSGGDDFEVFRE